jgi:hypothetical protein
MIRRIAMICCLLVLAGGVLPKAWADGNRLGFLQNIEVQQGETAENAVCFLCTIHVDGELQGNAVAFLGNIKTDSHIDGNAVTFLGNVELGETGTVGGNCVTFAGNVRYHKAGQVNQNLVVFPTVLLLVPILVLFLFIYALSAFIRRRRYAYPMTPPLR